MAALGPEPSPMLREFMQICLAFEFTAVKPLNAEEHTAYVGRHFMDCVIRLNGQVYAVRRVPGHHPRRSACGTEPSETSPYKDPQSFPSAPVTPRTRTIGA